MLQRRKVLAVVLCFLLWLIVCAGWGFSYLSKIDIQFPVQAGNTRRQVFVNQGLFLFLGCQKYPADDRLVVEIGKYPSPPMFNANYWTDSTLGFFRRTTQVPFLPTKTSTQMAPLGNGGWMNRNAVSIPYWSLFAVTTAIMVFTTWRWLRTRRRQQRGFCSVCGYDLRATPERCPECGTEAPISGNFQR